MFSIIQSRKIWYSISGTLVAIGLISMLAFGLNFGIDFTGGSLMEVTYSAERPSQEEIQEVFNEQEVERLSIQAASDKSYIFRFEDVNEDKHRDIFAALRAQIGQTSDSPTSAINNIADGINLEGFEFIPEGQEGGNNTVREERFESIGPVIGDELKSQSVKAILIVLIAIVLYVAYAFRKVSFPIQSWKYGIVALITLFHDILITLGAFALMSQFFGWELNTSFVAAILTILGYSVNDTIVVFDRIRENVPRLSGNFAEVVNTSVNQTISRSINTSFTTLLVLIAVLVFGGATITSFIATLIVGVLIGTYSSIFVASPLLVSWQEYAKKK